MENISYETLEKIGYKGYLLPKDAPEKVLQFGEAISCAPSSTASLTWATGNRLERQGCHGPAHQRCLWLCRRH